MPTVEQAAEPLGLRERKKLETRATISRVALELFFEHGFHGTTLKQIADAANVAPRTVSAYFPAKEELVFGGPDESFASLTARLTHRRDGETLVEALRDWIGTALDVDDVELEHRRRVRAVIESEPALRIYERGIQERIEQIIATAAAVDLGLPADHLLPRMVGAATVAAVDSLGRGTAGEANASRAESLALIDDAMAFVGAGIQSLVLRGRDSD